MSDKFNIDDSILLDPDTARSNNIKKILTGVAILVVLFLIILLSMKFINSGDTTTNEPLVMPSKDAIFTPKEEPKPAIKPEVVVKKEELKPTDSKPTEVRLVQINPEPKVVEIKPVQEIKTQTVTSSEVVKKEELKPVAVETKPKETVVDEKPAIKTEPKKDIIVVTVDKTEIKKVETTKKEIEKPKDAKITKTEQKETKKPEPVTTKENKTTTEAPKILKKGTQITGDVPNGSYIQILATNDFKSDAPSIRNLTNAGYNYRLYKNTVNGQEFTKVLVGPYSGTELQKEVSNIRATINKNAFVYRVK